MNIKLWFIEKLRRIVNNYDLKQEAIYLEQSLLLKQESENEMNNFIKSKPENYLDKLSKKDLSWLVPCGSLSYPPTKTYIKGNNIIIYSDRIDFRNKFFA